MNYLKTILTALFLLLLMAACSSVEPDDALAKVKAYELAHNTYDVKSTMALFAENAEFELVSQGKFSGLEEIRAVHEYAKGIHTHLSFQNCRANGLIVTCETFEENDWLDTAVLDQIYYPSTVFTLNESGLIEKIATTLSQEDSAALGGILAEYVPWLLVERSEESTPLFGPQGQFIYGLENGELNIKLLEEWMLIQKVEAYEKFHNAYDVDASLAMFTEDAVFELVGQGTLPNLEAIRAIHEYDKGIHAQINIQNCAVDGLTVTCETVEQNDWIDASGMGIGEINYPSSVFTFTDSGQIQTISATLSPEDSAAMVAVLAEFIPWLMTERPSESQRLFTPEGVFIYSEANGILIVDLLAQWRAEVS